MSADNPFPSLPISSLSKEEVVSYLTDLQAKGWTIYSDGNDFIIIKNDVEKLRIRPFGGGFRIEHESIIGRSLVGSTAFNLIQFKTSLSKYLPTQSPTWTRTVEGQLASNFSRISRLIGSAHVEAVYDPYLDDKGLDNLLTLVGLANSVSPNLRLTTSKEGARRLTTPYVKAFFKGLGCISGEIRKTSSQKPHRRFMLLSGGQSLIMGMSLNDLDKDEAAHLESDSYDRTFFESDWVTGQPV
jgi:hypothetical protein